MLIAAGAGVLSIATRRDTSSGAEASGNVGVCAKLVGDAARACYGREVGREFASISVSSGPKVTLASIPMGSAHVTFASADESEPLLCDLHARVGVVDARVPSWLGWTESLAEAVPQS